MTPGFLKTKSSALHIGNTKSLPLLIILMIILFTLPVCGETDAPKRGEFLTLKIAVFGPGDPLYVWWGHIGLIVEDQLSGRSLFYDYGLFSFENENFFKNFAEGRMLYSCGASPAHFAIERYTRQNRDITLYTLDLSPEKKEEVWRFAEKNILPENRDYYYHMFDDNCSTRIRDILDLATGGKFAEYASAGGRMTIREHVRRHTWYNPPVDWFLSFILGQSTDKQITIWDEMFLPAEVGRQIAEFEYIDDRGERKRLVSKTEREYQASNRPEILEIPKKQWPAELLAGLLLAAILLFLKLRNTRASLISLGVLQSILGLLLGLAGTLICYMAFFTNHDYSWNNLNTLFINPLFWAALPMGIISVVGRVKGGKGVHLKAETFLARLWTLAFSLALLTILLNLLPGVHQDNRITLAAFLPPSFVLSSYSTKIIAGLRGEKRISS